MALSGVPLLFSGFWSKDEILHAAFLWQPGKWPFLLGILSAFLTAFYMTRQMWYVFFGRVRLLTSRGSHAMHGDSLPAEWAAREDARPPIHESPPVMTIPLLVLAICAVVLGVFGTPVWPWFHSYLSGHGNPEFSGVVRVDTLFVMFVSGVIALGGIGLSWWLYSRNAVAKAEDPDPLEQLQPSAFAVLRGKFYIDELYDISAVRFNAWGARAARWLDDRLWSSVVTAVAYLVLALSWANRLIDEFIVNLSFDRGCDGFRVGARLLSLWQNGQVQRYLRVIALALAVFALVFIWGCRG
jgi:NADH-quinone oxidoreductase subunit L